MERKLRAERPKCDRKQPELQRKHCRRWQLQRFGFYGKLQWHKFAAGEFLGERTGVPIKPAMTGPGEMGVKPQSPVAGVKDADNADEILEDCHRQDVGGNNDTQPNSEDNS